MLQLSTAHVTQTTQGSEKSDWVVQENETDKQLGVFSSQITETSMFTILDFAKKYELRAFNIGIAHGKQLIKEVYKEREANYEGIIKHMKEENERLARALEMEMNRSEL